MFKDDIDLLRELHAQYKFQGPIVDIGGLEKPTIADYSMTIEAMKTAKTDEEIAKAQWCRYLAIEKPLSFLGEYSCENPETGGLPVEMLSDKYGTIGRQIGTAILLSVLEHVENPFMAVHRLWNVMRPNGHAVVSVPWRFPTHEAPRDYWRYAPGALRQIFGDDKCWEILECDWRLKIPASAGVLDIRTGEPQAIESCYILARAK